jgi:predicted transcriptional regulator
LGHPRFDQNTPARILDATTICSKNAGVHKTIHSKQSERVREALVKLRQNACLTQRQLARKLRREHSLISRLELGERRVDVVEFFWICQACGADPARTATTLMRQFAKIQGRKPSQPM